jgi:hypothetical protein
MCRHSRLTSRQLHTQHALGRPEPYLGHGPHAGQRQQHHGRRIRHQHGIECLSSSCSQASLTLSRTTSLEPLTSIWAPRCLSWMTFRTPPPQPANGKPRSNLKWQTECRTRNGCTLVIWDGPSADRLAPIRRQAKLSSLTHAAARRRLGGTPGRSGTRHSTNQRCVRSCTLRLLL